MPLHRSGTEGLSFRVDRDACHGAARLSNDSGLSAARCAPIGDRPGPAPWALSITALACGAMRLGGRGKTPPRVASRYRPREGQRRRALRRGEERANVLFAGPRAGPGPWARRAFRVDGAFRVGVDGTGAALNRALAWPASRAAPVAWGRTGRNG